MAKPAKDRDRERERPEPEPPPEVVAPASPGEVEPGRGPGLSAAFIAGRLLTDGLSAGGEVSARFAGRTGLHAPSLTASFLFMAGDFFRSGDDLGIRWLAGSLDACPGWGLGRVVSLEPCLRVTGGQLTATDRDVTTQFTASRWWGSGGVVLHAEVGRGAGFWLRAELGLDFPIVERRFTVETTSPRQAGATASISPTFAVGVGHGL